MTMQRTRTAREDLLAEIPVTHERLEVAGVATVLLRGGDGPPVVLLHGPAGSAAHWLRVIPDLVRTHRVIVPDLPGHGASAPVDGGAPSADRVVGWLAELVERTCPSPPALVGYALGGAIAARAAAAHGDRLSALVLVDALGLADFDPAPEFGRALQEFLETPSEQTHDRLWRRCAYDLDGLRLSMGERWERFEAHNVESAASPRVLASIGTLMEQFGLPAIPAASLARIDVPTTVIWGRHDLATRVAIAETASARFAWPLRVIDDCADDPPIERPEAFLRALRAALVHARDVSAAGFAGEVVGRRHARYHEHRKVFNASIDRRPALIARCRDARDVAAAVGFARERALPVSVYGAGHNVTGNAVCDDGVAIDLRPMTAIEVDPEARTCRAEAGVTWGELDAATQEHGLAVTGGRVSTTGLGGLTLGGGSGWIERACGYTVDNLLAVETVLADGRILTASASENTELFWATRGGGGNFGVVTRFDLRLHAIGPTVLGGMLLYPAAMAPQALANFRDAMAGAPDEVGAGAALITAPSDEHVPEPVRGQPVLGIIVCYAGPNARGRSALRPLREFGPPAVDLVRPMPYVAVQRLIDPAYPPGMRNHWTGDFLAGLGDEAIEVMCRFHRSKPSPLSQILVFPGGGVIARTPEGTMACGHERRAPFNVHITSLWSDPADDDPNVEWTRELSAALRPFTTGRAYVNFLGDEGRDRVVAAFGGPQAYAGLQALKDRYDPENLFRSNQNVEPQRAAS